MWYFTISIIIMTANKIVKVIMIGRSSGEGKTVFTVPIRNMDISAVICVSTERGSCIEALYSAVPL